MQHSGYCWIDIEIFVSKFKGIQKWITATNHHQSHNENQ
ncbi:hypothetical protein PEC301889_24040 [Pectobacterium carotovorum subsp. carotovorum]|nr:hypothetical protein PEC301889_24040 [Pectobacterium carotovorum subsp. carotovorum]